MTGPGRCITTKAKSTGVNAVFHENTKLKKKEEEEDYLRMYRVDYKGLFTFEYGASIFAYVSNMKIECKHAKYGLTTALSTI